MSGQDPIEERPYLRAPIGDVHEAWFRPMGFQLRVLSNSRAVTDTAMESYGLFGQANPTNGADFEFHLYEHEIDDGVPGNPIFRTDGPFLYQTTGRDSVLVADRERGYAYGYFSRTTLADPAYFRWHFLDLALFFMVEWRGFLGVHGAAICKNGRAILLRAPSGHGKSTLAYAGSRCRFQALAEDVVWIDLKNDLWWGAPSSFHLLSDARNLFPELEAVQAVIQLNGEHKMPVDVRQIRPDSVVTSGQPGQVVLMRRAPGETSRLEEVAPDESYQEWLAGSATKEQDVPDYERKVRSLLRRGVYRLHFGDDIETALGLLEPLFD